MRLVSLARSPQEVYGGPIDDDPEIYPEICLSGEQVKQLGLASAAVGAKMKMTAIVVLEERHDDTDNGLRIEFEIREAAFEPAKDTPDASSILYPNG